MKRLILSAVLAAVPLCAQFTLTFTPNYALAGDPNKSIVINGSGFSTAVGCTTTVNWNVGGLNQPLPPGAITSTTIATTIPASYLTTAATATISVSQGGSCSTFSDAGIFYVYPVPVITSVSPTSASAGTAGFYLTINATGLTSNSSVVQWTAGSTTTQLGSLYGSPANVFVNDSLLAVPGTATITIKNPDPAPNGLVSNGVTFTIRGPVISSLVPAVHTAGCCASGFALAVNGSDFVSNDFGSGGAFGAFSASSPRGTPQTVTSQVIFGAVDVVHHISKF